MWERSGGEAMLSGDSLSKTLEAQLQYFRLESSGSRKKLSPVKQPVHNLLLDPATTSSIGSALKTIESRFVDVPLGSLSGHTSPYYPPTLPSNRTQ